MNAPLRDRGELHQAWNREKKAYLCCRFFLALYWNGPIAEAKKRAHHASGGNVI
jgi:hypothetical protein